MGARDYSLADLEGFIALVVEVAVAEIEAEMRAAGTVAGIPAPARRSNAENTTTSPAPEA